jgi:lambda family phage portal protein
MLKWLKAIFQKPQPSGGQAEMGGRVVRARYDSAQTTPDNARHWQWADYLSANASNRPEIRRVLRARARYEVANNSYARGIVLTLANDVIGSGPRLQMLLGNGENDDGENLNGLIEREFAAWAKEVDLAGKLRTMRMAKAQDGEAFALMHTNLRLNHAVKLDLKLIEADQVATPLMQLPTPTFVDGIVLDLYGNPESYHILDRHPGDMVILEPLGFHEFAAFWVLHWFRPDRPGQNRGLPDILPALPLFAQLRRYTLAVIAAAETAADWAGVLYTDAPANGEAEAVEPMDIIDLEKRSMLTLPGGWKMGQVDAKQPTTTYGEFKHEILNEIARCLNMPFNIAACNSAGYNYSSGRLDHQTYYKAIRVEQSHLEATILDRILTAWLAEATLAFGLQEHLDNAGRYSDAALARAKQKALGAADAVDFPHQWFWDGHEHVDPLKESSAQAERLANNTTTLATEYARQGKDWETEVRQRAREVALMKELGLPLVAPKGAVIEPEPKPGEAPQVPNGDEGDQDEGDSQPAGQRAGRQRAA